MSVLKSDILDDGGVCFNFTRGPVAAELKERQKSLGRGEVEYRERLLVKRFGKRALTGE